MSTSANLYSGIVAYTSDAESMLILAQPTVSNETTANFNDRLEKSTVRYLASGLNHSVITDSPPPDLTLTRIFKVDRDEFDVETTTDISDISFALMSRYDESVEHNLDYYTYNIGTASKSIEKQIGIELPSNSIYDSNIKFNYSTNSGPFFSTSNNNLTSGVSDTLGTIANKGLWTAKFDETNPNVNYSKAINSEYNTSNYQKPLRVNEFDSFNKNYSLGMDLLSSDKIQNYFILDSSGKPIPTPISNTGVQSTFGTLGSSSFRLADNGLLAIKSSNFSNISSEHYGPYRIQQYPNDPVIRIAKNNINSYLTIDETNTLTNAPIFNANNNTILPKNYITNNNFLSLFNSSVENIIPGYKYTVNINEKLNSGYSPNANMIGRTDNTNTFTLDDSSLMNNSLYMKNYVGGLHSLSFTSSTLDFQTVSTASTSNVPLLNLNNQREILSQNNLNNGQIKINTRSPTTRYVTDNTSTLDITPNVFYNTEDDKDGILDILKQNSSVSYLTQLVAKNSKDISNSFMKNSENSSVSLDLYNGTSVSNSFFNTSNFEFNAINSSTISDAEVYNINTSKQVSDIKSFNRLSSNNYDAGTLLQPVYVEAYVENLVSSRTTDNIFQTARMLLNMKSLTTSSIYSAATNKGWNITIPSQSNGKMISSTPNAYASDTTFFPSIEETPDVINGIKNIKYSISLLTDAKSSQYVEIKWSSDNFVNSKSIIITENNMIKTQSPATLTTVQVNTPLILSGSLSGKTVKLYNVTSQRQISYSFNLPLRPFSNLTMITSNITVSLNTSDLCDMMVKVIGKDINNNNIDFTNEYPVSSMYGTETKFNLNSIAQQTNIQSCLFKVKISTEYQSPSGDINNIIFDSVDYGYTFSLNNNYDTTYSVSYWSGNISNITSKTNIAAATDTTNYSNKLLTISNGYSSINTWNTSDYYVNLSYEQVNNSTTVLDICKTGTSTALYKLKVKNSNKLNTQVFISNIAKDIYRFDSWIGKNNTSSNVIFSEKFNTVDYNYIKGSINQSNVFAIDTGIYLTKPVLNSTTFNQLSDVGKYIKFSLSGDLIGVNMINSVTTMNEIIHISGTDSNTIPNHTISNNGLSFQYVNGEEVSRLLIIDRYRGFFKPTNNIDSLDQIYTLQRSKSVATLSISRATSDTTLPNTISQSFDVFYNNPITINNLSGTVGNIGLKITCLLSMFLQSDTRNFTIYKMGDDVSFTILNKSANKIVPSSTTLQSFILDTFSGINFNNTGKPLSINSYRLKIKSNNSSNPFDGSSISWSIEMGNNKIAIYKNNNYLGNPENLDTNDAFFEPNSSKWVNINPNVNYVFSDLINGISIGPWIIKTQNTSSQYVYRPSISMFVLIPPYVCFKQVSSNTKTLPYVFSESDLIESYLPIPNTVNGKQTYNPFIPSRTYNYIATTNDVSNITLVFNPIMVNNVTFEQTTPEPLISNYSSNSRTAPPQYFVVEGSILKIDIIVGLKSQNSTITIATLFGGNNGLPANRLMYSSSISQNLYMDQLTNNNSGILMKLMQPLITNTPFSNLTVRDVFSNSATDNFNIKFKVDNFFILPSKSLSNETNNSISLDLPTGKGTKVTLYTRQVVSVNDGSIQLYVYKYDALNPLDYNNVNIDGSIANSSQTIKLKFLNRQYKKVTIPSSEYASAFTQLSLSGLPAGTKLNQSYDAFIASQAPKFENLPWISDSSFENDQMQQDLLYVSIECYTQKTQQRILPMLFSTRPDGKAKTFMVFKYPILTTLDKLGRKIFQITNWGSTVSNSIVTANLFSAESKGAPTNGDFNNILKNTLSGWSPNPISPPY